MKLLKALKIVYELAEQNALDIDTQEDNGAYSKEAKKQHDALETINTFIESIK